MAGMAGIIAQLTANARKRRGKKDITSAKCLYALEVGSVELKCNELYKTDRKTRKLFFNKQILLILNNNFCFSKFSW